MLNLSTKTLCTVTFLTGLSSCGSGGGFSGSGDKKEARRITENSNGELNRTNGGTDPAASGGTKRPGSIDPKGGKGGLPGGDAVPSPGGQVAAPVTNAETKRESEVAQAQTDFKGWCAKAMEIEPVVSGRLKPLVAEFCGDGTAPTTLFTKNLIASAYVGTGEPTFTDLKPLSSANNVTSYRFAVAIKLPITVKDHLDKVAPKAGDINEIKKLFESSGAGTVAVVTPVATHPASGKYHVQGFTTIARVTKPVAITTVTSEGESRNDIFKFVDGEQSMYTQYTTRAVQTIRYFDYVAASVKVENSAYLIVVVDSALDNRGFTGVAEEQVKGLAVSGIKQMYTIAAAAK